MTVHEKRRLLELIAEIRAALDEHTDETSHLLEFERILPGTDVLNLCKSDWDANTILEVCLSGAAHERLLGRDGLLAVVRRFTGEGEPFSKESDSIRAALIFKANCKHPASTDLIFWPADYFDGRNNPTAEEIVEKALRGY